MPCCALLFCRRRSFGCVALCTSISIVECALENTAAEQKNIERSQQRAEQCRTFDVCMLFWVLNMNRSQIAIHRTASRACDLETCVLFCICFNDRSTTTATNKLGPTVFHKFYTSNAVAPNYVRVCCVPLAARLNRKIPYRYPLICACILNATMCVCMRSGTANVSPYIPIHTMCLSSTYCSARGASHV